MNRVIKFRAWDKHLKKFYFDSDTLHIAGNKIFVHLDQDKRRKSYFISAADCEFSQFSGLTDKNGKEIYEGDIVRVWKQKADVMMEYPYPMPVIYCDLWCQFVLDNPPAKEQYGIWTEFDQFEVIGNIYQNKKLLTYR